MRSRNGYFTVEAALVLPMAIGVIFFGVYILLLQYNRCLLEQDMGILTMWGSLLCGEEAKIGSELENRIGNIDWEKYLIWEMTEFDVKIQKNVCRAEGGGQVVFPLPGWNFWNDENIWSVESEWEFQSVYPVEFVRMCNRLKQKGE